MDRTAVIFGWPCHPHALTQLTVALKSPAYSQGTTGGTQDYMLTAESPPKCIRLKQLHAIQHRLCPAHTNCPLPGSLCRTSAGLMHPAFSSLSNLETLDVVLLHMSGGWLVSCQPVMACLPHETCQQI